MNEEAYRIVLMIDEWEVPSDQMRFISKALQDGMVVIIKERRGEFWSDGTPKGPLVALSNPDNTCARAFGALMEES